MSRYRIGVFASGGGSNLQVLMDRIRSGQLPVELAFVLSNNSKSGALTRARDFGVPAFHVSPFTEGGELQAVVRMVDIVKSHSLDLLVLAGWMKKVPAALLACMKNRIVNIHPALLPAFGGEGYYGHKVHAGVIARGSHYSGITIHMVNDVYDAGQIIWQSTVPVPADATPEALGEEVLKVEHAYYWQVVRAFATGEIVPTDSDQPGHAVNADKFLQRMRSHANTA